MNSKDLSTDADDFEDLSLMNEKHRMEFYRKRHGNRRKSQSLPASPKLDRKSLPESIKTNYNPYSTITELPQQKSNISFLTSLFGITATNPSEAKANLSKKYENIEAQNAVTEAVTTDQRNRKITPKPHEYREMNIFSPTSM